MPQRSVVVKVTAAPVSSLAADALIVPLAEEDLGDRNVRVIAALDAALGGNLLATARAERFEAKPGQELSLSTLGRLSARRVLLAGLGPRSRVAQGMQRGHEPLRACVGRAARTAVKAGARTLAVIVPGQAARELPAAARAATEGALLGAYSFQRYRKPDAARPPGLATLLAVVPSGTERSLELRAAVELARRVASAVTWARDLVNLGPADCTPTLLARAASQLARGSGLRVKVRGRREIEALGMGLFLGVSRGSAEPPQLVQVSYQPRGAAARKAPLVLVGKAITFDSGGLSLKPTESMVTMNTDMAGSAAVLAVMPLVAALAPPFPVHAVLGACENMPGGRAYKPSDVLRAFDGQTVEITNTDAEGRLVLGDMLAWAGKTFRPAAMIDVATLTGACMVALGLHTAGLFGPEGGPAEAVLAASCSAGEDVWRMPLTEALEEQLESKRADMKNTGERWGGAITAAHFLHRFAGDVPWAHLDIAGPSEAPKERGYLSAGGTGFGVRTLVELIRAWK